MKHKPAKCMNKSNIAFNFQHLLSFQHRIININKFKGKCGNLNNVNEMTGGKQNQQLTAINQFHSVHKKIIDYPL